MTAIPKEIKMKMKINAQLEKSLPMKVLRWLWIILTCCLFMMAFFSIYIIPDSMARLMLIAPFLTGLITIMAGIAFGGSAIKRNALLKNGIKT